MKILHCISKIGAGGAEKVLLNVMREQLKAGHDVRWVAFGGADKAFKEADFPVPDICQFSFSRKDLAGENRARQFLDRKASEFNPDIIHSHLWPTSRLVEKSLANTRYPHVIHVHDTLPWLFNKDWRSRWIRFRTRRFLSRRPEKVKMITVSRAAAVSTGRALRRRVTDFKVIPNSLDQETARRLAAIADRRFTETGGIDALRVGTAGRLTRSKGHKELILAVAEVSRQGIPITLSIAGEGEERAALEEIANDQGLGKVLEGQVSNIPLFLDALDVFVLPSLGAEGLSIAQLEAMASGLALVVTDIAGAKEALQDGKDGLIVPPGDVDCLVGALLRLANEPGLRLKLGRSAASRIAREFQADRMAAEVEAVYQELEGQSGELV